MRNELADRSTGRRMVPGTWPRERTGLLVNEESSDPAAVQAALVARARLRQWMAGAQVVDLLHAASVEGWLHTLTGPTTVEALAETGGVTAERARRVVEVFLAAGVVRVVDGPSPAFVLTAEFAALNVGPSGVRLDDLVDEMGAARDRVRSALLPNTPYTWEYDALAVARTRGLLPTAAARAMFALAHEMVPEYRSRLAAGGPLLDVGSGVGGALLAALTAFPELRAVGIERAGDVVEELWKRAQAAGVSSRLEIRHADAQDLDDEGVYTVSYWAQAFFPRDARATTLAAVRRALVPGGLVLVQELVPQSQNTLDSRLRAALEALVADSRGVPPALVAEELATELRDGGFVDVQVVVSPIGRLVVGRRGE
ncbi:SAM-dependent methyltransferase [Streptomyces chartreusis]|uniref:SAM-dependent methyltransferase n=1 Tax=Streptomyces chartreusis TaxID=1969 RepID=UPI00368D2869